MGCFDDVLLRFAVGWKGELWSVVQRSVLSLFYMVVSPEELHTSMATSKLF